jgi:cellulose synthase/poly-beta-1,6-N-acetylglucosamine synthase-like glycosyltransferase
MISIVCAVRSLDEEAKVRANLGANTGHEMIFIEGRNPSYQRNEGVKQASGDIIYFIDDDSIVPEGLTAKAAEIFASDGKIAVLGGPELNAKSDTLIQRVFGGVFASMWAAGKSNARYAQKGARRESNEKELILCNMFIRREAFEEFGGFNEQLYPNEENELLSRMKEAGYKIVYDPELFIYRPKRKDLPAFIKQCFNYGRGRAEQSTVRFSNEDIINFVPAFFLMFLLSEIFLGSTGGFVIAVYFAGTAYFSFRIAQKLGSVPSFLMSVLSFFLLHISYGAGSLYGIYSGLKLKDKPADHEIKVKKA